MLVLLPGSRRRSQPGEFAQRILGATAQRSRLPADSDFSPPVPPRFVSFAWRYHGFAPSAQRTRSSPAVVGRPRGRDAFVWRQSACRVSGGDGETSLTSRATRRLHAPLSDPGRTGSARPFPAPRCCLPHTSRRRLPRSGLFRGSTTRVGKAPCVRFAAGVAPGPRNTRFRLAGPSRTATTAPATSSSTRTPASPARRTRRSTTRCAPASRSPSSSTAAETSPKPPATSPSTAMTRSARCSLPPEGLPRPPPPPGRAVRMSPPRRIGRRKPPRSGNRRFVPDRRISRVAEPLENQPETTESYQRGKVLLWRVVDALPTECLRLVPVTISKRGQ